MDVKEIVLKLVGEIHPVGESRIDEINFENLKEMCELVNELVIEIDSVSYNNKDRVEHSMKIMGEYADAFLKSTLGIVE